MTAESHTASHTVPHLALHFLTAQSTRAALLPFLPPSCLGMSSAAAAAYALALAVPMALMRRQFGLRFIGLTGQPQHS